MTTSNVKPQSHEGEIYRKGWDDAIKAATELHYTQIWRLLTRRRRHATYQNIMDTYYKPPKDTTHADK